MLHNKVIYKNNTSNYKVLAKPKKAGKGLKAIKSKAKDYIVVKGSR